MPTPAAFTGRAAQAQNLAKDGIKIRAAAFRNKKAYSRKTKHQNREV